MNPSRICFFAIFSKDFRKLRSSDVLAILLIAYGHILPKLFEFFKLNIEIAQNIFCLFLIILENMAVSHENPSKSTDAFYFYGFFRIADGSFSLFRFFQTGCQGNFFRKNVPWHILVSCKVAYDNLHLRESAHHWHVSAEGTHAQCVHVFYHFKVLIFLVDIHIPML